MLIKLFVAPFKKTYFEKDAFKVKSIQKNKDRFQQSIFAPF